MDIASPLGSTFAVLIARPWRPLMAIALPMTALAVALGRSDEVAPSPGRSRPTAPVEVDPAWADRLDGREGPAFLDPATGGRLAAPIDGRLARVAWSPRADDRGRAQVVGTGPGPSGEATLVRASVPDGAVLDRIPTAGLPAWTGAPCWLADGPADVLLAGTDGGLYRVDFDRDARPRPLAWSPESLADRPSALADLHRPDDARLGGRLIAAAPTPRGWSLRWLRLDADGAEVVASGRLTTADPAGREDRHPAVAPGPDGRPWLAYLDRPEGSSGPAWRLRAAPIDLAGASGDPTVLGPTTLTLADDASSIAPRFSPDGREVVYVPVYDSSASARLRRVRIPIAPARRPPAPGDGPGPSDE